MKNGKATSRGGTNIELVKPGGHLLWKALAVRFSEYLTESAIRSCWKEPITVLLHKKGDKEDLKNYRPICLLSQHFKLFTRIVTSTRLVNEQQLRDQAQFRRNYNTTNHIFDLNQLQQLTRKIKLPHTSCSSTSRKHLTKERKIRWAGHVTRLAQSRWRGK